MAHTENFVMSDTIPVHNGSLAPCSIWGGPMGLRINGFDPADQGQWDPIEDSGGRGMPIQLTVENADPQLAADIALLAKHTLLKGGGLWGVKSMGLPPERIGQAANAIRQQLGGGAQPVASAGSKEWVSAAVSSDMKHTSQFQVVALGELQQPGGVGAAGGYNPVTDGPNPDGPDLTDNAGNSPEQEQALQTWVNMAVDMINRGETPEAIVAQLAHDGCPDPQGAFQRAQEQPAPNPAVGQDPFEAPQPPDPTQNGDMQGLSQQPPVTARVRVAGTTQTGTVEETWESVWGERNVKVALDDGGSITVAPEALESLPGGTEKHPVTEIQSFIDSMEPVQPSRPYIEARLANLETVRRAVRSTISKVGFSDQVKLQEMDRNAQAEAALLTEVLGSVVEDFDVAYAKAQRRFAYNAFDVADAQRTPYEGRAREAGAIWASTNFDAPVEGESYMAAAATFASNMGMDGRDFESFLAGADEHRKVVTEEFDAEPETTADNDGPAEALFL